MPKYNPKPLFPEHPLYEVGSLDELEKSPLYTVSCGGIAQTVYHTNCFDYTVIVCDSDGPLNVDITVAQSYKELVVRPLRHNISPKTDGGTIHLALPSPLKLSLELDGDLKRPLFLLCTRRVSRPAEVTHLFEKGRVYNIDTLDLEDGSTVYMEEGSVVCGRFRARMANNIRILGNGILYGAVWRQRADENGGRLMVDLALGRDILVQGISVVDGGVWQIAAGACQNLTIRDVNILSKVVTGDGIDIVGCEDVLVEGCFIRACDDCISIKACRLPHPAGSCNVKNVLVQDMVLWNAEPGNALEIGYEVRCDEVSHITFCNCDIIHCEYEGNQSGGVFTIHNADRADIHDIFYEDIRVEDAQEKLVDFKILDSKYSLDRQRGQIRNVYFKNITVDGELFPVSIIRGFEMSNELCRPRDIHFDNFAVQGQVMRSPNQLRMVVELAQDIYFEGKPWAVRHEY